MSALKQAFESFGHLDFNEIILLLKSYIVASKFYTHWLFSSNNTIIAGFNYKIKFHLNR